VALHPTYGRADLRASFNPEWLRRQIEAIGGHAITLTPKAQAAPEGFLDVAFTDSTGTSVHGGAGPQRPPTTNVVPFDHAVAVGTSTLQVVEGSQAFGWCNDVFVNLIAPGRNAVTDASALFHRLGC
jgi:hypothetical protein